MRLSYSEQALVSGGGQPVLVSVVQQPRQVPSGAQVEPLRNPGTAASSCKRVPEFGIHSYLHPSILFS